MKRYEYRTIEIKLKGAGLFGPKRANGFEEALAREGADGWHYVETVYLTGAIGEVYAFKLVFEREIE